MYQNFCFPEVDDCCNMVHRNQSMCECSSERRLPMLSTSSSRRSRMSNSKTNAKSQRCNANKNAKVKKNCSCACLCDGEHKRSSNAKQMKNSQNFQFQDFFGKKPMEVINEEREDQAHSEDDMHPVDSSHSKKIQESCADFLSIVHDNVVDTVQKSVEAILRDYFVHTMEKIECLCSQMMRNECLLSKMYLDVMDKIAQQNEKSVRQFKCLCQFLAETRSESPVNSSQNDISRSYDELRFCKCTSQTKQKVPEECRCAGGGFVSKNSAVSSNPSKAEESNSDRPRTAIPCPYRKTNQSTQASVKDFSTEVKVRTSTSTMRMPHGSYLRVQEEKVIEMDQSGTNINSNLRQLRHMNTDAARVARLSSEMSSMENKRFHSVRAGPSVMDFSLRKNRK